MKDLISLVINVDTRPGYMDSIHGVKTMGDGVRSVDFLYDGILNKINFFKSDQFDLEPIVYVDVHDPIHAEVWEAFGHLQKMGINLYFNHHIERFQEHAHFPKWLDLNILNPIISARGKYVVHFDGDTVCYHRPDFDAAAFLVNIIDSGKIDLVSYPSPYSPVPITDSNFGDYWWASTRFFIGRRDFFDHSEILKCLESSEYLYGKYGEKKSRCPWLEHIIGMMAGPGRVFYPPMSPKDYMIFCFKTYKPGIISKLSDLSYDKVLAYVNSCGGIGYPNDVIGREI